MWNPITSLSIVIVYLGLGMLLLRPRAKDSSPDTDNVRSSAQRPFKIARHAHAE
jgi:hypothetical protein